MTNTLPQVKIFNSQTGEEIIRDANESEIAEWEASELEAAAQAQAEITKAADKKALLDRLGITADEARLLLS